MNKFFTQIFGLGPAGIGLAVAADAICQLNEFLRMGVVWFDPHPTAGGNIGHPIPGNSPGNDHVENLRQGGLFSSVLNSMIAQEFLGNEQPPCLMKVAELVSDLQRRLATTIEDYPASTILSKEVASVKWDGRYFTSFSAEGTPLATSLKIVLATGGREQILPELAGLKNVVLGSAVLSGKVVVVGSDVQALGGSHGMAAGLPELVAEGRKVTVWHRSPLLFFYPSVQAALRDGYEFSPGDVCPKTNRVHRFGGIRTEQAKFLRAAKKSGRVEFRPYTDLIPEVLPNLEKADFVAQFTGQFAKVIPIQGPNEHKGPLLDSRGHVFVDTQHRVYCQCGCGPIPGAFALGLCHQPPPSPELGGEPSYRGPVTGFNLFSGYSGEIVMNGLMGS